MFHRRRYTGFTVIEVMVSAGLITVTLFALFRLYVELIGRQDELLRGKAAMHILQAMDESKGPTIFNQALGESILDPVEVDGRRYKRLMTVSSPPGTDPNLLRLVTYTVNYEVRDVSKSRSLTRKVQSLESQE